MRCRRRGVESEEIDLWLLGGVARMRGRPHRATDEISFALAGPAVTVAVLGGLGPFAGSIGFILAGRRAKQAPAGSSGTRYS